MRIGMIGTGNIGFSFGPLLVSHGHKAKFGSQDADRWQLWE